MDRETLGFVSLFFQPSPFPMVCWLRECGDYSSILCSPLYQSRRSSKMWIDLLVPISSVRVYCHDMWIEAPWNQSHFLPVCARLVFLVALLIPFLRFPSTAMASGSKEGESLVPIPLLALFLLKPLVCLYLF